MNSFSRCGICLIEVKDQNREEGFRFVDVGDYYQDCNGNRIVITSKELAKKYHHLLEEPIYTLKSNGGK